MFARYLLLLVALLTAAPCQAFTAGHRMLMVMAQQAHVPNAPGIGTATAGYGAATVTFLAPFNGGAPITSYTVTSSPGGITATGGLGSITVTGLTPGVAYTFTVTAHNSVGDSLPSAPSNSVTPLALPGTVFLAHFDGTPGWQPSGAGVDVLGNVATNGGDATISASSKFGTGALSLNGTNQSMWFAPNPYWHFGGDFTIQAWINCDSGSLVGNNRYLISNYVQGTPPNYYPIEWFLLIASGKLFFLTQVGTASSWTISHQTALSSGAYHHIAVVRSGTQTRLYLDGVASSTSVTMPTGIGNGTGSLVIGQAPFASPGYSDSIHSFGGLIDEAEISNGYAIYTGNFTPPTGPYVYP